MTPNKLSIVLLVTSAVLLGTVFSTLTSALAQNPFDISTEQSAADQQAIITVRLATNNTVVIPVNGTVIEVPGNVTSVDNDTVIVTPSNDTITELPGNVTVISPPEPACDCPPAPAPEPSAGPIDPVLVTPAPGQEVITSNGTQLVANESQEEPIPIPPPATDNQTVPPLVVEPAPAPTDNATTGDGGGTEPSGNDTAATPSVEDSGPASFLAGFPWIEFPS